MTLVLELLLRQLIVEMSLLVSPRDLYLVWAGAEGKSSRPCQRTAACSAPHLTPAPGTAVFGRESLYGTVMGTHTHTLGDPKPPDQGHTVTQTQTHTLRHRETHACTHAHTHTGTTQKHTQGDPKSQLMEGRPPSCHKADTVCHTHYLRIESSRPCCG